MVITGDGSVTEAGVEVTTVTVVTDGVFRGLDAEELEQRDLIVIGVIGAVVSAALLCSDAC